jgi:hypothetical protein
MTKMSGCSYGKVSRNMIENLNIEFKEFRSEIRDEFRSLKEVNINLYNHLSNRIPKDVANRISWLTGILGAIIGGVSIGIIVSII